LGAIEIINLAIGLITTAFGAAKNAGIVGSPDWVKYADAGLFVAGKLKSILPDVFSNPSKYDNMTSADILALLAPATWDDLEARARAELGMEQPPPTA
jgi:hypothetical protein